MKTHYIVGAGGVGSWLTPAFVKLAGRISGDTHSNIVVMDGDLLENKNLDRQLYDAGHIGKNKASALSEKYRCEGIPEYYRHGKLALDETDWLLVGVDNNNARMAALQSCDVFGCRAIFGANETTSAEAYFYNPAWKDGRMDPRVYYPEMVNDERFDPTRAAIGCTGEAQEQNRQLVSANFMAAALMLHLYMLWGMTKLTKEAAAHVPFIFRQNMTSSETKNEQSTKE